MWIVTETDQKRIALVTKLVAKRIEEIQPILKKELGL
jgi:CRISPR/Cas system-associated endonuclease Cas1